MSDHKDFQEIAFDLPKNQSNVIKVIGVGGGGSNAINYMFKQGIKGVDFVICNTDAQALQNSGVPIKIQLGVNLTEGLGAGANPEVGRKAAEESYEDIKTMLQTNTKMVFITAGMGGGTGTGAAPIIAKMAKELDVLTVGIVTMPFQFEGKTRNEQAQKGIEELREVVDSLIIINNNKLREVYGNLGFKAGFAKADEVLSTASRGIAEVITHHYTQNIDLRDAKTVLSNSGTAIMGSATASGQDRAQQAINKALDSPLLNDNKITGAKNVLLLIVSGNQEITLDEIGEINDHIQSEAGYGANIIMGVGEDQNLAESISVTIIATGFNSDQQDEITNTEVKKVVHSLEEDQPLQQHFATKPLADNSETNQSTKNEPIVKHTLDMDDEVELSKNTTSVDLFDDNIEEDNDTYEPELDTIKDINVIYEEVLAESDFETDDFIITNKTPQQNDINEIDVAHEQITLAFDLPLTNTNSMETESTKIINDIEVVEHEEITSETVTEKPIIHTLEDDDVIEINSKINTSNTADVDDELYKDVVFEKKIVEPKNIEHPTLENEADANPLNTPISELLKERAEERKQRMKAHNHKFNTHIKDIENTPAYKRQGVELNEKETDSTLSRTTISTDDNDDVQLRNNNSYLHDNVD